jgi:catechol 2,3-dioxygenase-like lactoylglutathione lyase family enzyme
MLPGSRRPAVMSSAMLFERTRVANGTGDHTGRSDDMRAESDVSTRLPAQDLQRAKAVYAEKLGLVPSEERPGGLRCRCGSGYFVLFASAGAASGDHTQMAWEVEDLEATVGELRRRGVVFEEVDVPGLKTVDGIAEVEGNYPGRGGVGERGAWFRDCEGNLLGLGQPILELGR